MTLYNMSFGLVYVLTCLVILATQEDNREEKRILASDPNYVHSLELSVQDLKQKYETSNTHLTSLLTQLASDLNDSKSTISSLTSELQVTRSELQAVKMERTGHGVTYVRWGRDTCPANSTELVYTGYVGGSLWDHSGAAANYLCLPSDPQWYSSATRYGYAALYGTEYEETFGGSINQNDDVPCCVCRPAQRSSVLMIPGRTSCYSGWHTEYQGYLASGFYNATAATEYVCLDKDPVAVFGGSENKNGALFYEVVAVCGSLPCPPYSQGRTMTCVVCSK